MTAIIGNIFSSLIDLIYPPVCPGCGNNLNGDELICSQCMGNMTKIEEPICCRCGAPVSTVLTSSGKCSECPEEPIHFNKARSYLNYTDERVREIIHTFKFDYQTNLAPVLSELMVVAFNRFYKSMHFDAIIPIPLHKQRFYEREFNQSVLLSKQISMQYGIPIREDVVIRHKKTKPQASLHHTLRKSNMNNVFSVRKTVSGLSLLVVDDIYTTGNTVNELSFVLKKHGANSVSVLTLSRASIDQ